MPLKIVYRNAEALKPYAGNARTHSAEQVAQIARSIEEFGWTNPILVDGDGGVIAGHGRLMAAKEMGIEKVPTITVAGLTDAQKRALVIADNKLALNAGWDDERLLHELASLAADSFDLSLTGFDVDELDALKPPKRTTGNTDPDERPLIDRAAAVSEVGNLWNMGDHRLLCGSCTDRSAVDKVLAGERADLCLTDPPYGLGERKASGKNDYAEYEDTRENLVELAKAWLPIARDVSETVVFSPGVTNQWLYPEPAWVLCWFYGGGQLRSSWGFNCWQPFLFYGSQPWGVSAWEPLLAYGKDPSLAAGMGGRPDAVNLNVPANAADIDHPCPKPVALLEWLLARLVFRESALLYEPFNGSGSTMIAAEKAGHRVRAIELTPHYVDVAIKRWQAFTGLQATLEGDGRTFDEIAAEREAVPA